MGYNGSPAHYLDPCTLCYLTPNCLTTTNLEDGNTHFHNMLGDGIQTLAINTTQGALAVSEDGINARIFVYQVLWFCCEVKPKKTYRVDQKKV